MKPAAAATLAATLAACALGAARPEPHSFDLGIELPAARLPAVRVAAVRAMAPFDGSEMYYRLAWRNGAELAAYAQARWAAPPAQLVRRQLLRANGDGNAKCTLESELQEFSQVFSSPHASAARLELNAQLVAPQGRIASRSWRIAEAGAGADAAGGAAAMARAVNRAAGEIAAWIAAQAQCR
jgi:cholesterol transport system auxiliary component